MFLFRLALPFMLYSLLYAATAAENLTVAHDSATYLQRIVAGHPVFHPHHLLYEPISALWLAAWRYLGLAVEPAFAVAALNVLFGGLTLQMFFLLLFRRGGFSYGASLLGTALPGLSFGLWFYAGTVEVYVIPLFFLIWAFYLLTAPRLIGRTWVAAGAVHGLAVLFHQVHLLFGFVPIARLFVSDRAGGAGRWPSLLGYVGAAALVVVPAYAVVLLLEVRATSIEAAWLWFTNYAHNEAYWHGPDVATAAKAAIGFGRSVIGGHFLFAIPELRSALATAFGGKTLSDEAFLVRDMSPATARLLIAAAVAFGLLVLALAVSSAPKLTLRWREHRLLLTLTAAWFLPYAVFFLFWEPHNVEFWLPQSLCLWLALLLCLWPSGGTATRRERLRPGAGIAALAVLLFAVNYAGSLRFTTARINDYTYWRIEPLIAAARPGDLVLIGDWWIVESYLELFVDARQLALARIYERRSETALEETTAAVARTLDRGGRVFITEDVLSDGASAGAPSAPGYAGFLKALRNRIAPTYYFGEVGRRLAVIER